MLLIRSRQPKHRVDQFRVQPRYLNNLSTQDLGGGRTLLGYNALISTSTTNGTIEVGAATLSRLEKSQVIVQQPISTTGLYRYFFIADPSLAVCQCPYCTHFYEQVEWDMAMLEDGVCPFCRNTSLPVAGMVSAVENHVENSEFLGRSSGGTPHCSSQSVTSDQRQGLRTRYTTVRQPSQANSGSTTREGNLRSTSGSTQPHTSSGSLGSFLANSSEVEVI